MKLIAFTFLGAFGCAAGAFSYSTLSNRKNMEADAQNPNLYSSLENLSKDNRRMQMENIYDELSRKAIINSSTVPRRTTMRDTTTLVASSASTAANNPSAEYSMERLKASYDKLDFTRPLQENKPHYHSSSTLKSAKSREENHHHFEDYSKVSTSSILTDPSVRKNSMRSSHGEMPPPVSISHSFSPISKVFYPIFFSGQRF